MDGEGSARGLPHGSAVFEGVRARLEGAVEVGVDLVLALAALVEERELEERADVGALGGEAMKTET